MLVIKKGRLLQLFVDGCRGHPSAQFVIEQDADPRINYIFLGADRSCSKFLDGEIAEFLSYSSALESRQIDGVGKYLNRKFGLPWAWVSPKGPSILEGWLATHPVMGRPTGLSADKTQISSALSGPISVAVLRVSLQRLDTSRRAAGHRQPLRGQRRRAAGGCEAGRTLPLPTVLRSDMEVTAHVLVRREIGPSYAGASTARCTAGGAE